MHLSGCSFPEAVEALIGKDAGRRRDASRRPKRSRREGAREAQRRREEAEDRARKEMSAARIVARLQPVAGTPGETYLRDVRRIDVSHWAIRRALEDVETLGWCERTYFSKQDPQKPLHELNGQYLGAIVAILTDPVTGERTGGISRTYHPPGPARSARRCRSAASDGWGSSACRQTTRCWSGLHISEGIETGAVGHVGPADELLPDVGGRLDHAAGEVSQSSTASNA